MLLKLVDWITYDILGLSPQTKWGAAVNFFVYDSLKIIFILFVLIFVIGVLRTYLPQRKIKAWMGRRSIMGNFYAALFGAITPFCSCSSIPIFLGFLEAGMPLGVTFSFLITSPLINEYLVVLMLGFFGWKITLAYVISGLLIGVVVGRIIGAMNLERYLVTDLVRKQSSEDEHPGRLALAGRLKFGWDEAVSITNKVWVWVIIGVSVGAVIHNYIPQAMIENIIGKTGPFSVPIATLLGVPLYGGCAAIVPVAIVLFQKGVPLGTALSFMMAIAALSLPEAIMLRRAMRLQLIAIFFGITAVSIMATGYLFNLLQSILI